MLDTIYSSPVITTNNGETYHFISNSTVYINPLTVNLTADTNNSGSFAGINFTTGSNFSYALTNDTTGNATITPANGYLNVTPAYNTQNIIITIDYTVVAK